MKVPMKSKKKVSFEIHLNMHMSSTLIEYVLICIGRNTIHMYDKYIGPIFIQSSYCQWEIAMLLLDWPLTWKLPGLVVAARGMVFLPIELGHIQ